MHATLLHFLSFLLAWSKCCTGYVRSQTGTPLGPNWSMSYVGTLENGLEDEDLNPLEEFRKRMPNRENPDMTQVPPEVSSYVRS